MLVGKKACRLKKKCWSENFPCQERTCPECPEFPAMQDRKNGRGRKKRPRAYRGGGKEKKLSFGKKNYRSEKQNVGWNKNLLVEKKKM